MVQEFMVLPERAIEEPEEDALERGLFVERLCRALIDGKTRRSSGVTIGITGPWGSGKSSLLNLLHSYITKEKNYPNAVVVRFDPWIVSGHDDLIQQFFAELASLIRGAPGLGEIGAKLAKKLTAYGAHLAPIANLIAPGLGGMAGGGMKAMEKALSREKGLHQHRNEIKALAKEVNVPIVVIIDELDRVEDSEIRAIAQLVRAVLDFENISYVLAYDQERVIQALGRKDEERGRSYLEKIVQFQIPLPVIFDDELLRILVPDLKRIADDGGIPQNWEAIERWRELTRIIIPAVISTPRDVTRLGGAFHVLEAMLRGEVDWIDLLGYCCLLVKSPQIIEVIKKEPDLVCDNPMTESAVKIRMGGDIPGNLQLIKHFFGDRNPESKLLELLGFLFPYFEESTASSNSSPNAIYRRDRLLTVLRLGLLPGRFSKDEVAKIIRSPQGIIEKFLRERLAERNLTAFLDRLADVFDDIDGVDHLSVWLAFSYALRKEDTAWDKQFNPNYPIARSVVRLFERQFSRGRYSLTEVRKYFDVLVEIQDVTLVSLVIRSHIFGLGLFGWRKEDREGRAIFLEKHEIENIALSLSQNYRKAHLEGDWIANLLHLNPIYTMVDTGVWDEECKERLKFILRDDTAIIGLTLLLFGGQFTTDYSFLESIFDFQHYQSRVQEVLSGNGNDELHESAIAALQQALKVMQTRKNKES